MSKTTPATLDAALLDEPLEGYNLQPGKLRDQIGDAPTLLVFLRHLGCVFCRELVRDLRDAAEARPDYPAVLFFYQGTLDDGNAFFGTYWPQARAVADMSTYFYRTMGLHEGTPLQLFGPAVFAAWWRASLKGHVLGMPLGNVWLMPGLFLVYQQQVLWHYTFRHIGDIPDFTSILEQAATHMG